MGGDSGKTKDSVAQRLTMSAVTRGAMESRPQHSGPDRPARKRPTTETPKT
jgi:hypothetical protein